DLAAWRDPNEEDAREIRAAQAGVSYIRLDGSVGCVVNGAGLAMATMDLIKFHGGEPANFLDVGGGASQQQVAEAFRILLSDEHVKAVLVNIFGGILQCDRLARGMVEALSEPDLKSRLAKIPVVIRLEGTNVEEGRRILLASGLPLTAGTDLTDAAKKVVAAKDDEEDDGSANAALRKTLKVMADREEWRVDTDNTVVGDVVKMATDQWREIHKAYMDLTKAHV
ncbi:MAG: hypothetical protein AAB368_10835, partial [bacterium]